MKPDHPTPLQLERFMRAELPRQEVQEVVRHLLAGCSRCAAAAGRYWDLGERPWALVILLEEGLAIRQAREKASVF